MEKSRTCLDHPCPCRPCSIWHEDYLTTPGSALIMRSASVNHFNRYDRIWSKTTIGGVTFSFHPAGHVLGSAMIRVEYKAKCGWPAGTTRLGMTPLAINLNPSHATPLSPNRLSAFPYFAGKRKARF